MINDERFSDHEKMGEHAMLAYYLGGLLFPVPDCAIDQMIHRIGCHQKQNFYDTTCPFSVVTVEEGQFLGPYGVLN